ncbi:MAG TPA: aspartate-semialdehyde dehydrogenase [Balneolales bacterium]|nr:aspartate-semialdehyde dehydrogenase [Balneolales bacterium]
MSNEKTYNVGVLGATGAVGQKFIRLLEGHPWFTVKAVGASDRSAGKAYKDAVNWLEPTTIPDNVKSLVVVECKPDQMKNVDFVFSGLDSSVAGEIEGDFAKAGIPVISNAKNFRTHKQVPLLIPEVNPDHAGMAQGQPFDPNGKGFIVTNPNCVVVPLAMSLRPLYDQFGIESVVVVSQQAISGAGYPGVPSLDITSNVIPYIGGEESKIESEPLKLLGALNNNAVNDANFIIHATATRVPVIEGHTLAIHVTLKKEAGSADEVVKAFNGWMNPISGLNLPSAPHRAIKVYDDPRFPQPRLQAYAEKGMQAAIGRVQLRTPKVLTYVAMAHNTIRGAAGGAILNAELLVSKNVL